MSSFTRRRISPTTVRRVIRRSTPPIRPITRHERRNIELSNHIQHKPRQMILRQPVRHRRRQQHQLVTISRHEIVRHTPFSSTHPQQRRIPPPSCDSLIAGVSGARAPEPVLAPESVPLIPPNRRRIDATPSPQRIDVESAQHRHSSESTSNRRNNVARSALEASGRRPGPVTPMVWR